MPGAPRRGHPECLPVRLWPVLMTSIAFIMGVVPLVFSSGAARDPQRHGRGGLFRHGRRTVFGLFLTPVLYGVTGQLLDERVLPDDVPFAAEAGGMMFAWCRCV
jgi:hypothetical protein